MTVSVESAFMMGRACTITRGLVIKNPVKPDLFPDYVAVQAWPLVTALYNGIEQALKMLLLVPPNPRLTLEDLARHPYGHDLEKLYTKLEAEDRDHIEQHFHEHRSLHDYDPPDLDIATAAKFIAHLNSGGRQGGLVSWRYLLIQDMSQIPTTNLWAMSETWDAICCRIRADVFDKPDDCSRLSERLAFKFMRQITQETVQYDAYIDDLNRWIGHQGGMLSAWIDVLGKAHRDAMHEVHAPDRLRDELAGMARLALSHLASDSADPDHQQLLHRIETEPNLAWDPSDGRLHSTPPDLPTPGS